MRALRCPQCTAPVPPTTHRLIVCPYCAHVLADVPALPWGTARLAAPWEGRPEDAGRPRLTVRGQRFVVEGRIARGDSSDVFLGRRDVRLAERVILKVLRAPEDADLLARERRLLARLAESRAEGASYFSQLLPQPVRHGPARIGGAADPPSRERGPLTTVFRWRSGFTSTLDDVREAYPDGVDPRAAVWMWRRTLELLGFVHRSGVVHGAVLPAHLLIHARDHGVVLVGWTAAVWRHGRAPEGLPAFRASARALYPAEVWAGAPPRPATDLTMSARSIAHALGGDAATGRVSRAVPGPLARLIRAYADPASPGRTEDAWELAEAVAQAAREAFGPRRHVVFAMPTRAAHRRR